MKYIKYLFLFTVIVSLTACFPDNDKAFDGPTVLEFKPILKTVKVTAPAGSANALIQLVGLQQGSALTIPYTIDPTSTAVSGQHYTITGSGSVSIPPNSSSATIPIAITPGSVTAAAGVKLIINLGEAAGGIKPNPNFSKYTLTIVP
jgi:hypothetical protein